MVSMGTMKVKIGERTYHVDCCNCGGPAMGTDHSPDCAYVLDLEAAWQAEQEGDSEPDDADCGAWTLGRSF